MTWAIGLILLILFVIAVRSGMFGGGCDWPFRCAAGS